MKSYQRSASVKEGENQESHKREGDFKIKQEQ